MADARSGQAVYRERIVAAVYWRFCRIPRPERPEPRFCKKSGGDGKRFVSGGQRGLMGIVERRFWRGAARADFRKNNLTRPGLIRFLIRLEKVICKRK